MSDFYTRFPINKSASFVASQSGCEDNFYINDWEKRRVLGKRKAALTEKIVALKKQLGLSGKTSGTKVSLPKHVLMHPMYPVYLGLKEAVTELEEQIKKEVLKSPNRKIEGFDEKLKILLKEKYPKIFLEIKTQILKEGGIL